MSDLIHEARSALTTLATRLAGATSPSVRLGITGLSRAGKTVFITALVHSLINRAPLPLFDALAAGRITRAYLEPQPNDAVARFAYEDHLAALAGDSRHWPQSTTRLSQLRLTIEYDAHGFLARQLHGGKLHIDIVDYPGEWLLDLGLIDLSYTAWSAAMMEAAGAERRRQASAHWRKAIADVDAGANADETLARDLAAAFTGFLRAARDGSHAPTTLAPGRFLMPGDLAGSPLLTFSPLPTPAAAPGRASLWAMMERRYDAYVAHVVKPFFYDHFARLDRQIVLIDTLSALNAGAPALADLSAALSQTLAAFRPGRGGWLSALVSRRITRIVFAATKADLLHHSSHDRLERITAALVAAAAERARTAGADIDTLAMAAIRATREATVTDAGEELPCIVGVPEAGETIAGETFDGKREAAIFPGDLPDDPAPALAGELAGKVRFVRFRPPALKPSRASAAATFPHIRLDRAVQFLLGDQFS